MQYSDCETQESTNSDTESDLSEIEPFELDLKKLFKLCYLHINLMYNIYINICTYYLFNCVFNEFHKDDEKEMISIFNYLKLRMLDFKIQNCEVKLLEHKPFGVLSKFVHYGPGFQIEIMTKSYILIYVIRVKINKETKSTYF